MRERERESGINISHRQSPEINLSGEKQEGQPCFPSPSQSFGINYYVNSGSKLHYGGFI